MAFTYKIIYHNQEIYTSLTTLNVINILYQGQTILSIDSAGTHLLSTKNHAMKDNLMIGDVLLNCKNKSMLDNISIIATE